MTYLELVNEALRESGITLDGLTSSNFASPLDPMYTKMKQWVAQAWEDIQTDRSDWEFMQSAGVHVVSPRIEVYGAYSSSGTVSDFANTDMYMHNTSNPVVFRSASLTLDSGSLASNSGEGTIRITQPITQSFQAEPGALFINSLGTALCYFKRWGSFDLSSVGANSTDDTSDIAEAKRDSFRITEYSFETTRPLTSREWEPLPCISYGDYLRYTLDRPTQVAKPRMITQLNTGRYSFYPPPNKLYNVYFEYTRVPQTLAAHGDTPTGFPARFHKAISWRAVMYWAEYDKDPQQYNRAKERYKKFDTEMIRDLLPKVNVTYDARDW